jgi:DNA-binding GntR family transcriptional regulator
LKENIIVSLKHKSLVEKAAAFIRTSIQNGVYKPEERLFEAQIAEQIGVSRAPVREAIRMLENEGLVEAIPRRGVRVRKYSVRDIENIYTLRATLDTLATKLAVPNLNKKDIVKIKKILNRMKHCIKNNDIDVYSELNTEFHNFFYQRSRNEWLCKINNGLMNHIMLLRKVSVRLPGGIKRSFKEHEGIVKAIEGGNASEVADRMHLHMAAAWKSISRTLPEMMDKIPALKKPKEMDLIPIDDFHEQGQLIGDYLNDTALRCALGKAVDKPVGIVVRTDVQQKRVVPLVRFPLELVCVRRFDVNELLFVDDDQNVAAAELIATGFGFIEFQYGAVLKCGDRVLAGDTVIGEVAGFIEQLSPDYLSIIVKCLLNMKEFRSKIIFGQKVSFVTKT